MKKVFLLKGLGCANCAAKMERNIAKLKGVQSVSVNFMTQKMTMEADELLMDSILLESQKIIKKIESGVTMKPLHEGTFYE